MLTFSLFVLSSDGLVFIILITALMTLWCYNRVDIHNGGNYCIINSTLEKLAALFIPLFLSRLYFISIIETFISRKWKWKKNKTSLLFFGSTTYIIEPNPIEEFLKNQTVSDDKSLNWERPLEFLCVRGIGGDFKPGHFFSAEQMAPFRYYYFCECEW